MKTFVAALGALSVSFVLVQPSVAGLHHYPPLIVTTSKTTTENSGIFLFDTHRSLFFTLDKYDRTSQVRGSKTKTHSSGVSWCISDSMCDAKSCCTPTVSKCGSSDLDKMVTKEDGSVSFEDAGYTFSYEPSEGKTMTDDTQMTKYPNGSSLQQKSSESSTRGSATLVLPSGEKITQDNSFQSVQTTYSTSSGPAQN